MRTSIVVIFFGMLSGFVAMAEPLTHETAPRLSDKELGHLRNFVALANQPLDDFTGWEGKDQKGMEAYRYQIAFMTYALALQQYHSTPAYRDLYEDTIDRLIARMIEKPVWEFWEEVSKSSKQFDPDFDGSLPGTRDPVGEKNIMYSGHVLHMIALYESFYRRTQWSAPDALAFRWNSDESFEYDYAELIEIVHQEMLAPRLEHGRDTGAMECEPNLVFPECNQHPTLAFALFDHLRDTDYAARTKPAFMGFFDKTEMHHPETQHTAAYYMVKQDHTLYIPMINSASADGWTGAFMHAWAPDYVKGLYEKQRDDYIQVDQDTGEVTLAPEPTRALGPAFFANLAVEVGDLETAQRLFEYADSNYRGEQDENGFRFAYNMSDATYPVNNTTDKILAMARSNRPNGLWKLHNEPWTEADNVYPLVANVDFPNVLVRQAIWDRDAQTLLFTLEPLHGPIDRTTFRIRNIPTNYVSTLFKGDTMIAAIDEHAQAAGKTVVNLDPGEFRITTSLDGPTQFEIRMD